MSLTTFEFPRSLATHVKPRYTRTSGWSRVFIESREPSALLFGGRHVWRHRYPAASFSYISHSPNPASFRFCHVSTRTLLTAHSQSRPLLRVAPRCPGTSPSLYKEVRGQRSVATPYTLFISFLVFLSLSLLSSCTSYFILCAPVSLLGYGPRSTVSLLFSYRYSPCTSTVPRTLTRPDKASHLVPVLRINFLIHRDCLDSLNLSRF